MSRSRALAALGAAALTAGVTTRLLERRTLRAMSRIEPPAGWSSPRWGDDNMLMVPTDDGAELLVASAGTAAAGPTVVLVHGITSDHHCWAPVVDHLVADGCRVIGINQRGHGGSTIGTEGFARGRLGTDLGIVLQALDVRDAVVVGHSMGGAAALTLAAEGSAGADRVGSMVLVATLASSARPDRNALLRVQFHGVFDRLKRDDHHAPALTRVVFGRTPPRVLVDDLLEMTRRCPSETATEAARGMLTHDVRDQLASITIPTTVLCGTHDVVTSHRENRKIAKSMPSATFRSVPGTGHMVIWEDPAAIADAIRSHLPEHHENTVVAPDPRR